MSEKEKSMRSDRKAVITWILVTVNILVYFLEFQYGEERFAYVFAMYEGAFGDGEWFRALASGFLHFGLTHLVCNMLCLIALGRMLEKEIGSLAFAVLYLVSLLGGSLLIDRAGGSALHGGASGAVWGLMTTSMILNLRAHRPVWDSVRGVLLNLLYSFSAGVSWQAHIGGGIAGIVFTLMCLNRRQEQETDFWEEPRL